MPTVVCPHCHMIVPVPIASHICSKRGSDQRVKQILFAFWKYDLPPYLLGGMIEEFKDDGFVKVKGYQGMKFRPIAILPGESGEAALREIRDLQGNYDLEAAVLKRKYKIAGLEAIGLTELAENLKKENKK